MCSQTTFQDAIDRHDNHGVSLSYCQIKSVPGFDMPIFLLVVVVVVAFYLIPLFLAGCVSVCFLTPKVPLLFMFFFTLDIFIQ